MISPKQGIRDTLKAYEAALNASNTAAVVELYMPNAVFMPQGLPTFVGSDAIRGAYDAIFARIALSVIFTVVEAHAINEHWGFARTSSAGKQKVLATGETTDEANHELFVFENLDGRWLMARYCFSTEPAHE